MQFYVRKQIIHFSIYISSITSHFSMKSTSSSILLTFPTIATTSTCAARECFGHEVARYEAEVKIQLDNVDVDYRTTCEEEMQTAGITRENKQSAEKNAAYCALTSCAKVNQYIVDNAEEWTSLELWPKCTLNSQTLVNDVKISYNVCGLKRLSPLSTEKPDDADQTKNSDVEDETTNLKEENSSANSLRSTFAALAVLATCFTLLY